MRIRELDAAPASVTLVGDRSLPTTSFDTEEAFRAALIDAHVPRVDLTVAHEASHLLTARALGLEPRYGLQYRPKWRRFNPMVTVAEGANKIPRLAVASILAAPNWDMSDVDRESMTKLGYFSVRRLTR